MPKLKVSGIYKITSPSGKFYIGSSVHLQRRLSDHWRRLKNGTHTNDRLVAACKKYGIENLSREVIFCTLPGADILEIEQYFIDEMKPRFNIIHDVRKWMNDIEFRKRSVVANRSSEKRRIASIENLVKASLTQMKRVVRSDMMEFDSSVSAAKFMGYWKNRGSSNPISNAISQKTRCRNGFLWKHKDSPISFDELENNEREKKQRNSCGTRCRPVIRLTDGMYFGSANHAARFCGIGFGAGIGFAIKTNGVACGGHKWAYADKVTRLPIIGD